MKLRVVAWGRPYVNFEEGEPTWAVRSAIIDEIRKRGYDFSGETHQDDMCTPVLNNGKKYLFSTRGWADIMAEALGRTDSFAYLDYMERLISFEPFKLRDEIRPKTDFNEFDIFLYSDDYDFDKAFEDWFEDFIDKSEEARTALRECYYNEQKWLVPETDLNERFELEVTKEVFNAAQSEREVKLDVTPPVRYLDAGDTLALTCGGNTAEFIVADAERKKDFTEEKLSKLSFEMGSTDREKARRAREEFDNAKFVLIVKLK